MKNMFAFVGGLLVAFLAIGWYFGWYQITAKPGATAGHQRLEIDVNTQKIQSDGQTLVKTSKEKLQDVLKRDPNLPPLVPATPPPAPPQPGQSGWVPQAPAPQPTQPQPWRPVGK